MKVTQIPTFFGTIVSVTADGAPLVLPDNATEPVEGRIAFPVSRADIERSIAERLTVIGKYVNGDTSKPPTILMGRNLPPRLDAPDDESVDLDTFLAGIHIMRCKGQPPSTVGGAVRRRLRELQTPIRLLRHTDANFCIESMAQLPEMTHDLSPDQRDDLLSLVAELHARGTAASVKEEKEANRWRRDAAVRLKKLRGKVEATRKTFGDLEKALTRADVPASTLGSVLQSVTLASRSDDLPSSDEAIRMTQPPRSRPNPKVALYNFFVERGVRKDDAAGRAGKIVNLVLKSNVAVVEQPRPRSDDRRGSEAVRKAVERENAAERKKRIP